MSVSVDYTIVSIDKKDADSGYTVHTSNGGYIRVSISRWQQCCEKFGAYVMHNQQNVENSLHDYLGKEIMNIEVSPIPDYSYESCRWVEIHLKDDPDPLMLYVYNEHNGAYDHECQFEWKGQVTPDENMIFDM